MIEAPALYVGGVTHRRSIAPQYHFRYRYAAFLFDVDGLPALDARCRLFAYNRSGPISLHDRDYGPRDGTPLRPWIDSVLAERGLDTADGRVLLLTVPRVLNHAFNPLSVWFCLDRDERPRAVLCEVHNTFGEVYGYLLHQDGAPMPFPIRSQATKVFHVSPFLPVDGEYRFRFSALTESLAVAIGYHGEEGRRLSAVQTGERRSLTDGQLLRILGRLPPPGIRALVGIHWQALKIYLRGGRFHSKPESPKELVG
ncbi:DUF1365 domain-containing protein [Halorhodospira halophila]|uniref:DUF1365 domain-containing protein n=1 Tax=Halorhodospira halophila TaxID=1053 RepID=UPI001912D483|nr:DUF1365 domain-containing protein [Halorhodospira halophila]MBK5935393.1 hypothetical protein [Halorhodospira halophila]